MDKLRDFLKSWPGRILLVLCLSPLALLGIESYFYGSSNPNQIAQVGEGSISLNEYQNAVNARRSELLDQVPDASLINEDVLHEQVLKGLIDRALLQQQVGKLGMTISDDTITRMLQQEPGFQDENGQFSNDRFAYFLQQRGMTKAQLFDEFRSQLSLSQLNASIVGTAIYPMPAVSRLIDLQLESRHVWVHRIDWQDYQPKVSVTSQEISDYYEQNKHELKSQAMVDLAYIRITPDSIQVPAVSEADIERQYQAYKQEQNILDGRELSQILLTGADAAKQAQQLKARIDKGESFSELAKQHSDDPTGAEGGAIGRFNPAVFGADADKVAQALDGLQVGDVSQPVQSSYGYHLFKVISDHSEQVPTLESMREQLTQQAQQYNRQVAYADKVTAINDLAADGFGIADIAKQEQLTAQSIKDYRKDGNQTQLSQPAVVSAAFDEFNIQDQAVSAGIEAGGGTVWVQSSNYRPVATLTLEQASANIKAMLTQQKATALAMTDAQKIANGITSKADISAQSVDFMALGEVNRQSPVLTDKERSMAFSKPVASSNPDAVVVMTQETEQGVSILVADAINTKHQSQLSDFETKQTAAIIRDNLGQDQMQDYLEYLRLVYEVKINDSALRGARGH